MFKFFKLLLLNVLGLMVCSISSHAITHQVIVQDNNFTPANLTVLAGDTVQWENQGFNNHNVASTVLDYVFRCASGCDDTGGDGVPAGTGWVSEVTFHKVDSSVPYVCEPHVGFGMTGSISVQTPLNYETVVVTDTNGFTPQNMVINQYSRVLFINGGGEHNLVADDDSFRCADGCRDDGVEGFDEYTGFPWQVFLLFDQAGSISYHCQNPAHNESGVIHVLSDAIFANGFESL